MSGEAWQTRVEAPFVFHYQAESYVEQNLDAIAAAYRKALEQSTAFLAIPAGSVPTVQVYLCQFSPDDATTASDGTNGASEKLQIWDIVNSESPNTSQIELTRLLAQRQYGPASKEDHFWYDGLAGYLAGKGGASFEAEAPEHMQKLFDAGQLPPLSDLLGAYGIRQSATGTTAAIAFVGFLIERSGADRFKRFLSGLNQGLGPAFQKVYGTPVQSLEQSWYRSLETTGAAASGARMADALNELVPYLRLYRVKLFWILGCILVTISFAIFMPMAIRFLVNNILARRPLPFPLPGIAAAGQQLAAGPQQIEALLALLAAMVFMFILSAFSNIRRSYLVASMGEGVNFDLRMQYFDRLQRLPVAFHRRMPNQDISSRFWTDIGTISQALTAGIVPMAQSALAVLIFGIVLVSLNWKLSLIALAGLPLFAISFQRMRARTRETSRERVRRQTDLGQSLGETLNAQEHVKLYGLREHLTRRFVDRMQLLRDLVVKITLMSSASASTSALITNGAQVAVLILGGIIIIESQSQELTTGDLMAFYVLLLQFYAPAGLFTSSMQFVNQATTSLDRVGGILKQPAEKDSSEAVEIGPLRQAIRFESVTYGSGQGKDLIKDLSLDIPAGTKVAFIGPPGAGKASLMEVLPRLFDVASGAVTWDGVDLRTTSADFLRRQLAVVSQETFVFNATVYDNIRYGRIDAREAEVTNAARQAGLHDFVLGLPGGYDTQVKDRDATFGLVQRQRLAVARALLQGGSVVLMDDALSSLDVTGQRQLEDLLRGQPGERTFIRIAQRIGSILDADRIFVMDGGQLVEQGRHEDLTDAGGLYTQLLKDELGAGAVSGAFQAVRRLARQAPFSSLPPEVLEEVARLMLYAERSPGDTVCRQGSVGDELFVLGRGEVEVVLEEDDGQERILGFLHEGEYFGEISFLRRVPRTATVRARTQAELHILRRQDFDHLLERLGTDIAAELDRTAQERLDATKAVQS